MAVRVLIASTIAPHKVDGHELAWLTHADNHLAPDGLGFFLAAEVDARGLAVYDTGQGSMLLEWMRYLDGEVWSFSLDKAPFATEPYEVTSRERLIRICTGRNLAVEYAMVHGYTHILYLDTDVESTPDAIPRLLEIDRPLVYGHIPSYCLDGERDPSLPGDTRRHWSSAGFCLVSKAAFRRVRWGWDASETLTDDPTFARDVAMTGAALGEDWAPVTRHDVQGRHHPEAIGPLEQRGTDRRLYR